MSIVLDEVCKALKLDGDAKAKETVAVRIIRLARWRILLSQSDGVTGRSDAGQT
jgi:hypothetical protein